jgi:hypothetical protein
MSPFFRFQCHTMDIQITFNALPAFITETQREAKEAVAKSAQATVDGAKQNIATGQKSGRVYKRRGRTHQASSAGESPAGESGELENSGAVEISDDGMTGAAVFTAPYADDLELGNSRTAARPHLAPAATAQEPQYIEDAGRGMNDAARRVGKA